MARYALLLCVLLVTGCCSKPRDTITQISTIDALLAGSYDGQVSCRDLARRGDFGIGTFDALAGEMILVDGRFYQALADGTTRQAAPESSTPFAAVCRFEPNLLVIATPDLTYSNAQRDIDAGVGNPNLPCAVRIEGTFARMKTRSVPAQSKPYPPLAEVTKTQPVFEKKDVKGVVVGFRLPPFMKGVNVPGYHLHFLADDRSIAGHILDFELATGRIEVDTCHNVSMLLPAAGSDFGSLDLGQDRSRDLMKVEK